MPARIQRLLKNGTSLELLTLTAWAVWVARVFIDLDPSVWPAGGEWGMSLQPYHFWDFVRECGACALWNSGINGGRPALADFFGSVLHPFVSLPVLILGVSNGMKIALVLACISVGIGQWLIAKELNLGWAARMFSGAIAVISGPILQPLEAGEPALIISYASATIALALVLRLLRTKDRRSSLLLALAGAALIFAGHAYHQFTFLWWIFPFLIFKLFDIRNWKIDPVWKEFAIASSLSILIAGILLVPFLHFLPSLDKNIDPVFGTGQTIEYLPLNLVIRDWEFLHSPVLGKLPFTTPLYIGWIPLILAVLCLRFARRKDQGTLLALGSGALLILFMASGEPMRWLVDYLPIISGLRFIVLASGIAIPAILALTAYGLDSLIRLDWHTLTLQDKANNKIGSISFAWILIIPLIWSLSISYEQSRSFFRTITVVDQYKIWSLIKPANAEWISPPFGNHYWIEPAMTKRIKLTDVIFPFGIKSYPMPKRKHALTDASPLEGALMERQFNEFYLYSFPRNDYAYVISPDDLYSPCAAQARGGFIDIACNAPFDGTLIVQENAVPGWMVWVDDQSVQTDNQSRQISFDLPQGSHAIALRFYPLDAAIGVLVSALGLGLWIALWHKAIKQDQA